MSKKDYVLIAGVIAKLPKNQRESVGLAFCNELAKDNPKFDALRFMRATEGE